MSTRTTADPAVLRVARVLGLEQPRVSPLSGGGGLNRLLRLTDAHEDVVLRLGGAAAPRLGASRESELAVHRIAADAGLAPRVRFADPARGILVTDYVEGAAVPRERFGNPEFLARVGRWFGRLHALPLPKDVVRVDFGERAAGYLATLRDAAGGSGVRALEDALAARRAALGRAPVPVACHHDLHHRNLRDAGELLALDWEYAGAGDAAADLAACIGYHELDAGQVDALLACYGPAPAEFRARVAALAWIFDCLRFGWHARAERAGYAGERAEKERLFRRLLR